MRYTIRELKLGEVLDQAVKLTKDHLGVFLGITAILLIPYNVISGLIQVAMAPTPPPNATQEQLMAMNVAILRLSIPIALVAIFIIAPITNAALVYAISNGYLGKPISVWGSVKWALGRIIPLIWTWIIVGFAIMGGSILCLVPGILASFWFALATQVVVIEGVSGFPALKRSKALMAGNIGNIFILGLLLGLINLGVTIGVGLIPQPHLRVVVLGVVEAGLTIFASAAIVAFYFSCRCKLEQFDLALLAQSVGIEAPTDLAGGAPPQW